ncbi:MAG: hypothetical protein ACI8QC_003846 [Planctomycetota bacterium]|jgi:hypothetical protein
MKDRTQRTILESLDKLRLRWMQTRFVSVGLQALFYLLLAGAAVLLAFPGTPMTSLAMALLGTAALVGALTVWFTRPSAAALAKDYDDSAGLKDRISSSVELMDGPSSPMVEALVEDAAIATARVAPAQVYAYSMPREGRWLPLPLLMLLGVVFLSGPGSADQAVEAALEAKLAAGVEAIEDILSEEQNEKLSEREKEMLEQLRELKAKLSERGMEKKDAMAEVAKLLDQLEREEEAAKEGEKKLKELLAGLKEENKDISEEMEKGDWQDALNKLREKMKELEDEIEKKKKEGASEEELEELEQELAKMKEIEAKFMKFMNLKMDAAMLGHTMDFLEAFEGDLADLENMDPADFLKPCDCDDPST